MKSKVNLILFFLFSIMLTAACQDNKKRAIKGETDYQREQNAIFKDASRSPLTKKDLKRFTGLDFFPVDSTYVVEARIELTPNSSLFKMATTTDRKPLYREYGVLHFELQGKKLELTVYRDEDSKNSEEYKDYLFLPFTDATSGEESYGGGRYMNLFISDIKNDSIILNFNNTYNPYCAYNKKYSCPLTPRKNHLNVAIRAGIKDYKKQD